MSTCTVCIKDFDFIKESSAMGHDVCLANEVVPGLKGTIEHLDLSITEHLSVIHGLHDDVDQLEGKVSELQYQSGEINE